MSGEAPRRLRPVDLAERHSITERTAGEWLRAMVAAGVVKKLGRIIVGRLSATDFWVENGGAVKATKGGKP